MNYKCLRCENEMEFLKQYKFDSQESNRGILKSLLDIEEHLILNVYVCPHCKHTEFFYAGKHKWLDL